MIDNEFGMAMQGFTERISHVEKVQERHGTELQNIGRELGGLRSDLREYIRTAAELREKSRPDYFRMMGLLVPVIVLLMAFITVYVNPVKTSVSDLNTTLNTINQQQLQLNSSRFTKVDGTDLENSMETRFFRNEEHLRALQRDLGRIEGRLQSKE